MTRTRTTLFGCVLALGVMAAAACADTRDVAAPPTAGTSTTSANAHPGELAFVSSQIPGQIHVVGTDGRGHRVLTHSTYDFESQPDWSSDGRRVAFVSDRDGDLDVWVMNADGTGRRQVTRNDAYEYEPDWSPDGAQIAFERDDGLHDEEIYVIAADKPAWSPEGRRVAFTVDLKYGAGPLFVVNVDGTKLRKLTDRRVGWFDWSPDGRKIAFSTWQDVDDAEIYVIDADGSGEQQLTRNGDVDIDPQWSPDTRRIAFVSDRDSANSVLLVGEIYAMDADGGTSSD